MFTPASVRLSPKYQTRTSAFDDYSRLKDETTPEGGAVSYTYKPNDLVATVISPRMVSGTTKYKTTCNSSTMAPVAVTALTGTHSE
jgi:hypothetical protein